MKHLNLTAVVLGLACGSLSAYPVWDEQNKCLKNEGENNISIDYNTLPDKDLLVRLVRDEDGLHEKLRELTVNMTGNCIYFSGAIQNIKSLSDTVTVSGELAEILRCEKISAPTAIYIYQIMYSEPTDSSEQIGENYNRYLEGVAPKPDPDPFVISKDSF